MTASSISLEQAKQNKLFYVVANVVVFRRSDARCLILKRAAHEVAHPGKWAMPGGKLEWNDLPIDRPGRIHGDVLDYPNMIEDLLAREAKEEAGIEISRELVYVNSVAYIRPDGVPTSMVKFAAEYVSGDVRIDPHSFDDYAWVNAEEVKTYDCLEGIKEEVQTTIDKFSS